MEHFYHLQHMGEDYFTYPSLYKAMVEKYPEGSRFVELGCFKGKSAAYLAVEIINSGKKIRLDCVDLFVDCPQGTGQEIKNTFLHNIRPVAHNIHLFIGDSVSASQYFADQSIDFVFVDAAHTYEGVRRDLVAWLPKIRPGGIIAGHDYEWVGVRQAVDEILPQAIQYDAFCYWLQL